MNCSKISDNLTIAKEHFAYLTKQRLCCVEVYLSTLMIVSSLFILTTSITACKTEESPFFEDDFTAKSILSHWIFSGAGYSISGHNSRSELLCRIYATQISRANYKAGSKWGAELSTIFKFGNEFKTHVPIKFVLSYKCSSGDAILFINEIRNDHTISIHKIPLINTDNIVKKDTVLDFSNLASMVEVSLTYSGNTELILSNFKIASPQPNNTILLQNVVVQENRENQIASEITPINDIQRYPVELISQTNYSILGIGEGTHGTSEFSIFRNEVAKSLLAEKKINSIMLEASPLWAFELENYIHSRNPDLSSIVKNAPTWIYATSEFVSFIKWMRSYNQKFKHDPIHIFGFDLIYAGESRIAVSNYIKQYAPSLHADIYTLSNSEILQLLSVNRSELIKASGELLFLYINYIVTQFDTYMNYTHKVSGLDKLLFRDSAMANNVMTLRSFNSIRGAVLFAHNTHVSSSPGTMGGYLRKYLFDKYCSIGLAFGKGSYLANAGDSVTEYYADLLPHGSLEELLYRTSSEEWCVWDLRKSAVPDYFCIPMRDLGAVPEEYCFVNKYIKQNYDLVFFKKNTVASHPVP